MDPLEVTRLVLLVGAVVANSALSFFVYKNNPTSTTNRLYVLLSLVISFWLVANYISLHPAFFTSSLFWIRSTIVIAAPMVALLFLLAHTIPHKTFQISKRSLIIILGITAAVMIINASPYAFTEVNIIDESPQPTAGAGLAPFALFTIILNALVIFVLTKRIRHSKGIEKAQLRFVMMGIAIMLFLLITTVLIPVAILQVNLFVSFIPIYTLIFLGLVAYAMIKHSLLDIRGAIFRSLSLSILIGAFLVIYGLIFIYVIPILAQLISVNSDILAAASALISIPIARTIQKIITKITDKFLFQDKVDYQASLAQLGQSLSRTIQINEVTKIVITAMREVIRTDKAIILLQDEKSQQYVPRAAQGAKNFRLSIPTNHILTRHFSDHPAPIVRDELKLLIESAGSTQHLDGLKEIDNTFEWLDVSVAIPLLVNKELTGIILLGDKLSGDPYLVEDVEFLSAFSAQASTALENARLYKESLEFGEKLKEEVERATHDLEIANDQLKDLDKAKSEFLSIASHQLYTPLTALNGYLSMIKEGDFGDIPDKQTPIIDILQKSTIHLITLIKNLLDVSRIEAGRLELELESINLVELADELVKDLMPNSMSKNLDLIFHRPDESVTNVVADRERIRQVLLNFIDNAIKYTSQGTIDVRVIEQAGQVTFSVTDSGKGMTQMDIRKLFNKFTRVGGAERFHTEGTGLGLYVAKQIVEEHHGEVKAASPGKDQGSTFSMIIPAEGAPTSLKVGQHTSVKIKAAEAQQVSS